MAGTRMKYDSLHESVVRFEVGTKRPTIRNPRDVAKHHKCDLTDLREQFRAMLLNTKNGIIEDRLISLGSLSASIVHPREVLKPAILCSAASIIIYHNHPTGDTTPSREDVEFSRRLKKCCELIGIELLDSIIVGLSDGGRAAVYSLAEAGMM